MKYGIYLPNFGSFGEARRLGELAQAAEEAGWDGFFLWDHVAGWGKLPLVDPWIGLAAAALSTRRIRLGTTVTPVPRRRPWKLARETVSLDRLSGGRLILSVGTGAGSDEWDNLGEETDARTRGAMLDEGLEVLAGLWSGEPFSYAGAHYRVKNAQFLPKAAQTPRIPVWVGGFWPRKAPMRRAARWEGAFPLFQSSSSAEELAQLEQAAGYLRSQREALGCKGPFDLVVCGVTGGDDPAGAWQHTQEYARRGATWWLECIVPFAFGQGFFEEWPEEALWQRVRQGPPRG